MANQQKKKKRIRVLQMQIHQKLIHEIRLSMKNETLNLGMEPYSLTMRLRVALPQFDPVVFIGFNVKAYYYLVQYSSYELWLSPS